MYKTYKISEKIYRKRSNMKEILITRVLKALTLTNSFYAYIQEDHLKLKIQNVPSNSIGEQAWCIIGARESYLRALIKGQWDGFSCSLSNTKDKELIMSKLQETYSDLEKAVEVITYPDISILIDLLEHEVQHHGQLIRYAYSNGIGFPQSWNERYTV